ncbi:MAG: cell division protein FtsQ [Deltaproteobacteria bacterium]|nr:cell division protein FtsQ [Deltaproteobacteria bacterium]
MAVAGPKRKRSKTGSGWSWRLAGIALCAFFALGVITGLSQSGHILARRIEALLARLPHGNRSELIPAAYHTFLFKEPTARKFGWSSAALTARGPAAEIALIEYPDGFFQIDSKGGLRSMVSSADAADLPVISGSGVETADASQLVEYAGQLIRAEAALSAIISEMHVTPSGEMHLFLERPHLEIVLAPGQLPLQLARAARVLEVWRGRRELIGVLDMTISSEAIVRPQAETMKCLDRATASRGAGRPG